MTSTLRALTCLCFFCSSVCWAIDYDESVDGDLPDDRLNPAFFTLDYGSNVFSLLSGFEDRDYFTLTVPPLRELQRIDLLTYSPTFGVSFLGMEAGPIITTPAETPDPSVLLGYSLFGFLDVGSNLLIEMSTSPGAIQFTPPLPAGQYAFWAQETAPFEVTFTFNFIINIIPKPLASWLLPLLFLAAWRRLCSVKVTR